jgi:hypothetical protein
MLRLAGLYTGTDLNESEDAWKLGDYSDRWIDTYLAHEHELLPAAVEESMDADLSDVLEDHAHPLAVAPRPWGWKEPRSIYLLPFFHRRLPALRFLHVVRDGRDMALSRNQNQLRKHGDAAPIPADLPPTLRSIALWSWVNLRAMRYGEEKLEGRYLRIRFEELCAEPAEVTARVLRFVGLNGDAGVLAGEVVPPATLARWRHSDPDLVAELERVGGEALVALGYELVTAPR